MLEYFQSTLNMPGMKLPIRSTLVTDSATKRRLLFSPVRMAPDDIQKIRVGGELTDIVAPNLMHHLFFNKVAQAFPMAKRWGVDGFEQKRPDIDWQMIIREDNWAHNDLLEVVRIQGMPKLNEVVFYHRSTKSLLCFDLCFNLLHPEGPMAWPILSLLGTYKQFNVSRMLSFLIQDRAAFTQSVRKVLAWDFEQIVMAHGEIVQHGGKAMLEKSLRARKFI